MIVTQGTVGIFRDISLVSTSSAVISFVTPQVFFNKDHWDVRIAAYLMCKRDAQGPVTASLDGLPFTTETTLFCEKDGEQRVDLDLSIPENAVKRWFPVGYGEHPTYGLTVSFGSEAKTVHIGFRTAELIREKIGEDEESMYFRINDIDVFIRGESGESGSP